VIVITNYNGLGIAGIIPDDEMVKKYDFEGLTLISLPAGAEIRKITNAIFKNILRK
jgi:hypothetical protein